MPNSRQIGEAMNKKKPLQDRGQINDLYKNIRFDVKTSHYHELKVYLYFNNAERHKCEIFNPESYFLDVYCTENRFSKS